MFANVNKELCISCGACMDMCPVSAIDFGDDYKAVVNAALCIGCHACMNACPMEAIGMTAADIETVEAEAAAAEHALSDQSQAEQSPTDQAQPETPDEKGEEEVFGPPEDIVYFEFNNWFCGRDYPSIEPVKTWMADFNLDKYLLDPAWAVKHRLVVATELLDSSVNICVSAPRQFVEKKMPLLFTVYSEYLCEPEGDKKLPVGHWDAPFLEYKPENFGVHYFQMIDDGTWSHWEETDFKGADTLEERES